MKKKGFTLVEIIAIILILGIVLILGIPKILNMLESSKTKAYVTNVGLLVKNTEGYLAANKRKIPLEIKDTTEINIDDLVDFGITKQIKSPFTNKACKGYVLVTKIDENEYEYTPHIDCINNIDNSFDNKLLVHYRFDDFQEPTENLIPNSHIFSTGWSSYGNGNDKNITTEFGIEGLNIINRISWAGGAKALTLPSPGAYTLSVLTKVIDRTNPNIMCTVYSSGGGLPKDVAAYAIWTEDKIRQWQKLEMTNTYTTNNIHFYLICYGGEQTNEYRVSAQYTMPQVEKKPYATPYTNGIREGIVTDYSKNNNKATLTEINTPRWVEDRNGSYSFSDGKYIAIDNTENMNLSDSATISLYVKPDINYPGTSSTTVFKGIIGKSTGGGTGQQSFYIDWYGTNTTRKLRFAITDGTTKNQVEINDFDFKQKWTHLVVTWNSNKVIAYINGEKVGETVRTITPKTLDAKIEIGKAFASSYWSGNIDDVRIYERALSEEEVELLYLMTKE